MLIAENVTKSYFTDGNENKVLKNVSLSISRGDFVCIIGRSGSGKTTLLNILATLLKPDTGRIMLENTDIGQLKETKLNSIRNKDFSIVFQFHQLLPYLTAMENVLLPFMNTIVPVTNEHKRWAKNALDKVGLKDKYDRLPGQLSGGEQQRVAIARAIVKFPKIIFADEPTGNLDKKTGNDIIKLLKELNDEGLTVIMVTHEHDFTAAATKIVEMDDGSIIRII